MIAYSQPGYPFVDNFPPLSYNSESFNSSPQNFGLEMDFRGVLYVANANGIITFDGENWNSIRQTENSQFFKLGRTQDGIYTGGLHDFGKIQANNSGELEFHSFKSKLGEKENFSRIYRVDADLDKVFLTSPEVIIQIKGDVASKIPDSEGFSRCFFGGANWYLFSETKGLFIKSDGGDGKIIPLSDEIKEAVRGVWDIGDSVILLLLKNGRLLRSMGKEWIPLTNLDGNFQFVNSARSKDGNIWVGTINNGLIEISETGNLIQQIKSDAGLISDYVFFPKFDEFGDLWCAMDYGVSRVEIETPLRKLDKSQDLQSVIMCMISWDDKVYIGTQKGLFKHELDPISREWKTSFEQFNSAEILGFSDLGESLLIISAKGFFLKDRKGRVTFSEYDGFVNGFSVYPKENHYEVLVLGQNRDLTEWQCSPAGCREIRKIAKLPHPVYSLERTGDNQVWAGYIGLSRVDLATGEVMTLDSSQGLVEEMGIIEVSKLQGRVVFGTELGIYKWDEPRQKLVPDETFGKAFADGSHIAYNLTETRAGDVWVTTNRQTGILRKQPDQSFVYDSLPIIKSPNSDVFAIYEDPEGKMWFGGPEGAVRYDPAIPKDYHQAYYCLVRKVTVNNDSVIFWGNYADADGNIVLEQPESFVPKLEYEFNHLTFSVAAPFYEAHDKIMYSHRLDGQETEWSEWTKKTEAEYTNLKEGEYTFRARARNIYGTISEIGSYRFRISPPWYRTFWAKIIYGILGLFGVWGVVRLNSRRLVAANRRLEKIVDERTEEIRVEKEKSDNLLLNILPKETAEELKQKGFAETQHYDLVTVMFADFKGFTHVSEKLNPRELVQEIHFYFSQFDRIVRKHGIEKIKTIGDAYMCAGGLPIPNDTHPQDVVRAAMEINAWMEEIRAEREAQGSHFFEMRIGIHTGPVVAGIVGLDKFQYDIWGDTVNIAARMESSGEPGKINISGVTYELIKDHFQCTFRGKIDAKNKGKIEMYFVEGQ